jgi:hypothetical protein
MCYDHELNGDGSKPQPCAKSKLLTLPESMCQHRVLTFSQHDDLCEVGVHVLEYGMLWLYLYCDRGS